MVNLTIDGKQIQVEEGMTILQAALAHGIRIPYLCYHPAIKAIGSCRICVVEVKPGPPRPQPACTTKVTEGMEVVTNSQKLQDIRRELVKFMLVNHPLDCPWCDKGGECQLQDLTHELGIGEVDYEAARKPSNNDFESDLIERYNTRCVTCGRCVRVCKDRVGASAINFENRGYFTDLGSGQLPLNCEFCGTCIEVCPVGALINKLFKYTARAWEVIPAPTVCQFCGGGCRYQVHIKDGKVLRVRGQSEDNPLLCVRGRFGFGVVNSPERVTKPMIKKGGQFVEATWDEALDFAANGLMQVMAKSGASAIYGVGSPRATNETNYLFQKFFRVVLGSNQLDNPGRYNYVRALEGLAEVFGWPEIEGIDAELVKGPKPFHSCLKLTEEAKGRGFPFVLGDSEKLAQADVVLVIGADVTPEMPPYGWKLMEARAREDFRLIVANPRKTKYDRYADVKLRYRPGTERAVLLGLMEAILESSPGHTPYLEADGFEEFKDRLLKTSLSQVKELTGISAAELREAGRVLAEAQAPAIIFGQDLMAQADGKENVIAVADLFLLIGRPCNPGSGLYPIAEKNNTRGICEVGVLPDKLPGYQELGTPLFQEIWQKSLNPTPGSTLDEALQKLESNAVTAPQAFYLMGGDLIRQLPNSQRVLQVLQKAKFIIYQGAFLTEAAKLADVFLPVTIHAEISGTYTNTDGRLGQLTAALPADGPKPGWQIIAALSRRLDYPLEYANEEEIFKEMGRLMPIYAGLKDGLRWPCPQHPGPGKGEISALCRGGSHSGRRARDPHRGQDFGAFRQLYHLGRRPQDHPAGAAAATQSGGCRGLGRSGGRAGEGPVAAGEYHSPRGLGSGTAARGGFHGGSFC